MPSAHADLRPEPRRTTGRRPAALPARRRAAGAVLGTVGLVLLTVTLEAFRGHADLASVLLLYLALTLAAAAVGGIWPGALTGLVGFLLADWFFTQPYHTWTVDEPAIFIALVVFALVAGTVSVLVDASARRAAEAARARREAAALARMASTLLDADDPLPRLVNDLRETFDLDAVALLTPREGGWHVDQAAGRPVPTDPEEGSDTVALPNGAVLVLTGGRTPVDERRILTAFTAQLALALATQALRREAADATALAAANRLRTALLSSVSHDLRTPLSSIKASASSLLQPDVDWPSETHTEFLEAIVEDVDHLNALVGNLLDMSRLKTGAVHVRRRPVGLAEVVSAALVSLPQHRRTVQVDVAESLPDVLADPALLERVVANLVDNACKYSPPGQPVHLHAVVDDGGASLTITDHGSGIPIDDRHRIFQPFQRLDDRIGEDGVGLGLAVASGFMEAMQGTLTLDDAAGGGTTFTVRLPLGIDAIWPAADQAGYTPRSRRR